MYPHVYVEVYQYGHCVTHICSCYFLSIPPLSLVACHISFSIWQAFIVFPDLNFPLLLCTKMLVGLWPQKERHFQMTTTALTELTSKAFSHIVRWVKVL